MSNIGFAFGDESMPRSDELVNEDSGPLLADPLLRRSPSEGRSPMLLVSGGWFLYRFLDAGRRSACDWLGVVWAAMESSGEQAGRLGF